MWCCLCGRPMQSAAVTIGEYPVGPSCARRAGLMALSKRKSGLVFPVARKPAQRQPDDAQIELFK